MTAKLLHESSAKLREASGNRWKATLITPGIGASGSYAESMLSEHAASAFPKGTKLWFMHPKKGEGAGQRDPRDQWGFLAEDAHYEPGVGIVGEPEVLPHWREVVESLGVQASLSVWVMGESDEEGNITALLAEETNSIDIVSYPGRPGSGLTEKLYESALAASAKPGATSAPESTKEGKKMEEKLDALIALFSTFVTESKAAATASAVAEADADAIETAKTEAVEAAVAAYDAKVAAISAAEDLLPSQIESLRAAAKAGDDITPLIESAKAVVAEFKTVTGTAGTGRVTESSNDEDWGVSL